MKPLLQQTLMLSCLLLLTLQLAWCPQVSPPALPTQTPAHFVEVKSLKHLLHILAGRWAQVLETEELAELVEGELAGGALSHELLVPLVAFGAAQLLHRLTLHHITHCPGPREADAQDRQVLYPAVPCTRTAWLS